MPGELSKEILVDSCYQATKLEQTLVDKKTARIALLVKFSRANKEYEEY